MTVTTSDDYDPYLFRVIDKPITNSEAFVSLLKCAVGIGCLAMPKAFANAGWLNGLLSTVVIGAITVYCLHLLLQGMHDLCKRKHVPQLSYPETMVIALSEGPPCLRCLHGCVGVVVDFTTVFYNFGVCSVYVVFIADNFKAVGDNYFVPLDSRLYMFLLVVPLILLYFIRELKNLVPLNMLANVLLLFGFIIIFYYILTDLPPLSERHAFVDIEYYPLFFGTVLFAIESVGVIISIESKMKHPEAYLGLNGILNWGLGLAIVLYVAVAFFGYWRYGDRVKESITLNLPQKELWPQIAKILFATAIFLSYALQNHVTINVMWPPYARRIGEGEHLSLEYVMRTAIVLGTVLSAMYDPHFALILSLVGSFCLSHLGLTFPAVLDLCVKYTVGYGPLHVYLLQDIFLIIFGILGCLIGTWASIKDLHPMNVHITGFMSR